MSGRMIAAAVLLIVVVVFASWIAPYRPGELSGEPLRPPSLEHVLGTNNVGQDLASQLLVGARTSLTIALLAGVSAVAVGLLVGLSAAWLGRWVDVAALRLIDVTLVLPRLPLLILLGAYAGTTVIGTAAAIAATGWAGPARLLRARALGVRRRGDLRAAVGFGAGPSHLLRRHLLPELGPLVAAALVATATRAVMMEAGLALLGIGDLTRPSWGTTIREALAFRALFRVDAWMWWLLPPVLAVSLTVYVATLLGAALDTRANPRAERKAAE
jgi:peptide/nickel transport system permease protein